MNPLPPQQSNHANKTPGLLDVNAGIASNDDILVSVSGCDWAHNSFCIVRVQAAFIRTHWNGYRDLDGPLLSQQHYPPLLEARGALWCSHGFFSSSCTEPDEFSAHPLTPLI